MYMSYCRFEGTKAELRACFNDVEEHLYGEQDDEISEREIQCFRGIVADMIDFLNDNYLIDEDGMLDRGRLDEICDLMAQGAREEDE